MFMGTFESSTGASVIVLDSSTGEILADQIQFISKSGKYIMPGGFAVVALVFFSKLAELDVPKDALKLCARIMASSSFGGLVNKPNEEYAKELGVDKSRISRLIWKLHDVGVLHRIGPRTVFINPAYFFRGTAKAQNEAVKQWAELRLPKIVDFKSSRKSA